MSRMLPHRIVALIVLLGTALAVSTALAYWRTTGSGGGSGTTGNAQTITLSPGTATAWLYPDGQSDLALTVDNPNRFRVSIGSLSLSPGQGTGGYQVDAGHAGCVTSVLGFSTQTNAGAGWIVPPKVGSTDGSLPIDLSSALTMTVSAASACQGASFTVYLTAGP